MDFDGRVFTINSKDIKFDYRKTNLPKNFIFLSASFKSKKGDRKKIEEDIFRLKEKKKKFTALKRENRWKHFQKSKKSISKKSLGAHKGKRRFPNKFWRCKNII